MGSRKQIVLITDHLPVNSTRDPGTVSTADISDNPNEQWEEEVELQDLTGPYILVESHGKDTSIPRGLGTRMSCVDDISD